MSCDDTGVRRPVSTHMFQCTTKSMRRRLLLYSSDSQPIGIELWESAKIRSLHDSITVGVGTDRWVRVLGRGRAGGGRTRSDDT